MKVRISVRGRTYTVQSDEDDVDIEEVARFLDGKMAELSSRSRSMDEYTVAMLTALNIASDLHRFQAQVDAELAQLDKELAAATMLVESTLPVEDEDAPA